MDATHLKIGKLVVTAQTLWGGLGRNVHVPPPLIQCQSHQLGGLVTQGPVLCSAAGLPEIGQGYSQPLRFQGTICIIDDRSGKRLGFQKK